MLALIPEDATVMMMSDHGFDAIYRQVNMANWVARTEVPELLQTMAVPPLNVTNGILHYSLQSQLAGGSDREAFLDRFIQMCKDLEDPETGVHPFQYIFRREDIYHGRMLEKAPDLVFHEHDKYFVTRGKPDSTDMPIFQDVWTTSFSAHPPARGHLCPEGAGGEEERLGDAARALGRGRRFPARQHHRRGAHHARDDGSARAGRHGRAGAHRRAHGGLLAAHPVTVEEVPGFLLDRPEPSTLSDEEREQLKSIPYIQ